MTGGNKSTKSRNNIFSGVSYLYYLLSMAGAFRFSLARGVAEQRDLIERI